MTDYLYATPGFVGGIARALDLGDTLTVYNVSPTPAEADHAALNSDWIVVGNDLRSAVDMYAQTHGQEE